MKLTACGKVVYYHIEFCDSGKLLSVARCSSVRSVRTVKCIVVCIFVQKLDKNRGDIVDRSVAQLSRDDIIVAIKFHTQLHFITNVMAKGKSTLGHKNK